MIGENIRLMIDQWLDGDLPEADETVLQRALETDLESLTHLADRAVLHRLLREAAEREAVIAGPVGPRRNLGRPVAWVAAAIVACTVLGGLVSLPRATAGPVAVVKRALQACRTSMDRRYAVHIEPTRSNIQDPSSRPAPPSESTLWVRDARFVQSAEVSGGTLVWGRDTRGAVWFALSRRSIAVFDADEIPEVLREVCELRTLELETLLTSLLRDFDLERFGRTGNTDTVVARPRAGAGSSKFGSVRIDIDSESLLVTNVSLERLHRERAVATIRFTLEETTSDEGSRYEWQHHADADAEVLGRDAVRGARSELLGEFLRRLRGYPAES